MSEASQAGPVSGRVRSIDALRGFDMFWIIGGKAVFVALFRLAAEPIPDRLAAQLKHASWEGFTAWDLIMPLFLFVVGASMPFSFAQRVEAGQGGAALYAKIARRTVILFVLGMVAQGHLLAFDLSQLHLYCNTLQAIACGYVVAAIVMLNLPVAGQLVATAALLVGYWLLMVLVPVPDHGAGILEPNANLALYIDEVVLGRFRDGSSYTWILSGMGFASTVLLGVLSGHLLRCNRGPWTKVFWLAAIGAGCLLLGWVWGMGFPIIKHVWSSSMVLWAAGWSYLLLAVFYGIIDAAQLRRWAFPFVVVGMNAIFIYMAVRFVPFGRIGNKFVGGLAQHAGEYEELLRCSAGLVVAWLMLYYMYRKRTFVRV